MIVFGQDFDGNYPSGGTYSNLRVGDRILDTITYEAIEDSNLTVIKDTIDELELLYTRNTPPRMTTSAWLFQNGSDYWTRNRVNKDILTLASDALVRQQDQTFIDEAYGLTFRLYCTNPVGEYAFFDNSFLEVSNILWEFSPDGGTNWYPYYDIPNRADTHVMLMNPTTHLRVRAVSNDTSEWVQSFEIIPITDRKGTAEEVLSGSVAFSSDAGMIAWPATPGAEVYAIYNDLDELVAYTHANSYTPEPFDPDADLSGWYVIAMNAISHTEGTQIQPI